MSLHGLGKSISLQSPIPRCLVAVAVFAVGVAVDAEVAVAVAVAVVSVVARTPKAKLPAHGPKLLSVKKP